MSKVKEPGGFDWSILNYPSGFDGKGMVIRILQKGGGRQTASELFLELNAARGQKLP